MKIRKAVIGDVKGIHRIINRFADQGLMLPRSLSELYDHIRDYYVLEAPDSHNAICGVCALGICWEDLAEIRSLALDEDQKGKGFGKKLVEVCIKEARDFGLKKVFVLTYIPNFFKKQRFQEVEKASLPQKIWADCLKCPKFPDCDETALMIDL
jgi:amino-acid N-acetyltransferase